MSAELDLFVADSPVGRDQAEAAVVASDAGEVGVDVGVAKVDLADTRVEDEGSVAPGADSGRRVLADGLVDLTLSDGGQAYQTRQVRDPGSDASDAELESWVVDGAVGDVHSLEASTVDEDKAGDGGEAVTAAVVGLAASGDVVATELSSAPGLVGGADASGVLAEVLVGLRASSRDRVASASDSAEAPASSIGEDDTARVPGGGAVWDSNAGV